MLRIFSSSNLALLDSSDIEEVHQDFEMEKGGGADLRPSKKPAGFFSSSNLALLDSSDFKNNSDNSQVRSLTCLDIRINRTYSGNI
jgi:hypothetical protein